MKLIFNYIYIVFLYNIYTNGYYCLNAVLDTINVIVKVHTPETCQS